MAAEWREAANMIRRAEFYDALTSDLGLAELAPPRIGITRQGAIRTLTRYNRAASGGRFV